MWDIEQVEMMYICGNRDGDGVKAEEENRDY